MRKSEPAGGEGGCLPKHLVVALDPELQNALSSPIRRELLRILSRRDHPVSIDELMVELRPHGRSQLGYHLQVLGWAGTVDPGIVDPDCGTVRYASQVSEDGPIRAVLRATERCDGEQRETTAAASVSPLLTMFRIPRPVRTIRLRSQRKLDAGRER